MAGRTKLKKRQVDDQFHVGDAVGTSAYVVSAVNPIPYPAVYAHGSRWQVKVMSTSTGNITLDVMGIGPQKVFKTPTIQATSNDWIRNQWYILVADDDLDLGAGGFLMTSTSPSSGGIGVPGGGDGAIQYNEIGGFGGDANFTIDEITPGVWVVALATAAAINEGRLLIGGSSGLGAIEFGGGAEIRGARGLDVKVDAGAAGLRMILNAVQRLRISDAGELMIGPTNDPGTAGQVVGSAGPGQPFAWVSMTSWNTTTPGLVQRSTQAQAIATADAVQLSDNSALSGSRAFSEFEMYDFNRALMRLIDGGTFTSIVNLTTNRRKFKQTVGGAIAYTKTGTYSAKHEGNLRQDFMIANGVNKPTFSADFIIVWDNWLNTNGQLNVITFEYMSSGKIAVDMRYV